MLTVIVIIAILASVLATSLTKARTLARQADCKSNMRQLGASILIYRSDFGGQNPPWLSCLYPSYVDDLHLFICRSDVNHGKDRTRPLGLNAITGTDNNPGQDYPETIDNISNTARPGNGQNISVTACSYFYEFSSALMSGSTNIWNNYKEGTLLTGDANSDPPNYKSNAKKPYSPSRMPMIRCYHHYAETTIRAHADDGTYVDWNPANIKPSPVTINVAHAGNVYVGPLRWEAALLPGEQ